MSSSCSISRAASFDGHQSLRIHSVEPSPAPRPRRHRPLSLLRSAMGSDDASPSPTGAGGDTDTDLGGRLLLNVSSAPERSFVYPRRALRSETRAHETGLLDRGSLARAVSESRLTETETAEVPADGAETSGEVETDLDLLLNYKLSEPPPSQEVSVLSWTLSADTPADDSLGLLQLDNDDQPTWAPSLEGDSAGRRTPEPPPKVPVSLLGSEGDVERGSASAKETPGEWLIATSEAAAAMVSPFPFLANKQFDKFKSQSSPRTPAEETFAWLQVCLNYRGPPDLSASGDGCSAGFFLPHIATLEEDAATVPDEFVCRDQEFISLPLQIDRKPPKDRDFSNPTDKPTVDMWHPSTVATTTSFDLSAAGLNAAPFSPGFKSSSPQDLAERKPETPTPISFPEHPAPVAARPRLNSCEATPSSASECRRSGLALFSRPPVSARLDSGRRHGRLRHKSQTPRSRKSSRTRKLGDAAPGDGHRTPAHRPGGQENKELVGRPDTSTKLLLCELIKRLDGDSEEKAVLRDRKCRHSMDDAASTGGEDDPRFYSRFLRQPRRPRLATVAGRFYRSSSVFDEPCCDRAHEACSADDVNDSEVESLIRGICQEADSQVNAALEERDIILRETAADHQRFLRAINKLEASLQEKELENMRLVAEATEERRRLKSKCEQLEEALEKWERSFDRLKGHASERETQLGSELKQAKESGMSKDSEIAKLNAEIIRRAHEFTSLQKQLHETREFNTKEICDLKRSHEDSLRLVRKKHEEEMSVLDQHWTTVVSNLNQMLSDVKEKSDARIAELQEKNEQQTAELNSLKSSASLDKKRTQTIEAEWRDKLKEKETELSKIKEDCEELASSLHKLKKAYEQLKKRNVPHEDYLNLKQKHDESVDVIGDLKNVLTSANDEKEDLKTQMARCASRSQQLEKSLMEKEVAITIKGKMIEEQSLYMSKMREKLQSYEEEIADLKMQRKRQQDDIQKAVEEDRQTRAVNPVSRLEIFDYGNA
eukprot:Gregarina_sp_Poly_1__9116@NODE_559_length_7530_cov_48_357899_g440_i0_p1_GENE_NODE_559_length_7530_cov_48_357899_g440_i0NODE_559_length_7530_cov_48_357899_g440_i0_p1_ORF_typecomplete_len1000_score238_42DUF812/PF05667_11/2_8e05DUF812/PF05667_11/4_9e03TACC_C/PF05010_14/3_9e05TACC_C/PF05010_14/1_5e02TACC_C/PF05010_14/8e03KASH_CCD/PF14662_6/0_87KASH_CCD/PF14662_6/3KASH_CCD/PF14662_6/2_6Filament/PF00038_21/1_1Filament/PF00038_21/0_062Filament/PF00038_21/15Exog_C/PF18026_1/0_23AAA_13/PF13166_6/1_8e03AA